jgi:hypothetical protein
MGENVNSQEVESGPPSRCRLNPHAGAMALCNSLASSQSDSGPLCCVTALPTLKQSEDSGGIRWSNSDAGCPFTANCQQPCSITAETWIFGSARKLRSKPGALGGSMK